MSSDERFPREEALQIRAITKRLETLARRSAAINLDIRRLKEHLLIEITDTKAQFPIDKLIRDLDELNKAHAVVYGEDAISNLELFETVCAALE